MLRRKTKKSFAIVVSLALAVLFAIWAVEKFSQRTLHRAGTAVVNQIEQSTP